MWVDLDGSRLLPCRRTARAADLAGNSGTSNTEALTLDTTAPSVTANSSVTVGIQGEVMLTPARLRFDDDQSDDAQETYAITGAPQFGALLLNDDLAWRDGNSGGDAGYWRIAVLDRYWRLRPRVSRRRVNLEPAARTNWKIASLSLPPIITHYAHGNTTLPTLPRGQIRNGQALRID